MTSVHGPFRSLKDTRPLGSSYKARLQEGVWEQLVFATIRLLGEAAYRIKSNARGFDYQNRPEWWGSGKHTVRGSTVKLPEEDTVTDALTRAATAIIRSLPANDPIKQMSLYVVDQRPRDNDRLGARSHPTDIQVSATGGLDYLDLRIEAKRLLSGSDLSAYIGANGMQRFWDPVPYTTKPIGMMLGYSFRHDDAHWHNSIGERCETDHGIIPYETVTVMQKPVRICRVQRAPGDFVTIAHLLLSLDSDPSARQIDVDAAAAKQARTKILRKQ